MHRLVIHLGCAGRALHGFGDSMCLPAILYS